jgi:FlaA1/EpsC-like NDP-sugar epimerase
VSPWQKVSRVLRRLASALDGDHLSARELTAVSELAGFLRRPAICLPSEPVHGLVGGRRVLVTGAGGTIGSELCRQIASCDPASLVMVDRYENGLHAVALDLAGRAGVQPVVGDITDPQRLDDVVSGARPEIVLHAAAHKHVPLMERNPCEAMKNNIVGTRMVVDAAIRYRAARFVLISTDKAVRPSSVMGATKRAAELVVQCAARDAHTRCAIVRFGNVLGSNGSVFHTFRSQVRAGGPVTVTHPDVRRFFMLVHEAVQLVLHAAAAAPQGAIAVLDIGDQIPIIELAHYVIRLAGLAPDIDVPVIFTGLRPGEKLDEELVGEGEHLNPSKVEGIGWVAAPDRHDWLAFTRHLGVLESLAFDGVADEARLALNRLLEPFGGVHASTALRPAPYATATAS